MASCKISIIAAALPPKLDGIGDYTANLAGELATQCKVTVLTGRTAEHTPIPGVTIKPVFSFTDPASVGNLAAEVKADAPDWVLLQYNPFAYGHWGLNLHLPEVLHRLRRSLPRTRVAIMMHETFVPVANWQFVVMTTWQRWQFWRLGCAADVLLFSTEVWAQRFQSWFPKVPCLHLPVSSNIPLIPISRDEARTRLNIPEGAVVLGLFGGLHISRLMEWCRLAADAVRARGHEPVLLHLGPDGDAVSRLFHPLVTRADGTLPAEEISRRFAAMDVLLSPFSDGVSTRRTSFMTGLQHGIATVATSGQHTDALLHRANQEAFLMSDVKTPEAFTANVLRVVEDHPLRQRLGQGGKAFYEREFSWETITERLLTALGTGNTSLKVGLESVGVVPAEGTR